MSKNLKMNPNLKIMIPVVRGLAKILGKDYEVNLHDVTMPEHSLVMCENGHVTGRAPGAPMTDFGLYMLIESLLHLDMENVEQYPEPAADNSQKPDKFPVPIREWYAKELEEVVTDSLTQVKNRIGTPLNYLSKPEKKEVIKELHDRGFFLLKGSVDRVANEMGNTKYTIYSYIRDVQKQEKLHKGTKTHTRKDVE